MPTRGTTSMLPNMKALVLMHLSIVSGGWECDDCGSSPGSVCAPGQKCCVRMPLSKHLSDGETSCTT